MKIDRLLGITIYLLNHEKATATLLAEKYEVSIRTIQRDINTLCLAGIPVISTFGVEGGYQILDTFKMERQIASKEDYSFILAALRGFHSAYESQKLGETIEKIQAVTLPNSEHASIILDFGVLKEKQNINAYLITLEKAIVENKTVKVTYTNAADQLGTYEIEPVAVVYKWFNWYLVGYSLEKEDYRLYKLVRMEHLYITENTQVKKHDSVENILASKEKSDTRKYINIQLKCNRLVKMKVLEYLNGKVEMELEDGTCIVDLCVPEDEHFWFGTLLALGDEVEVIHPREVQEKLRDKCLDILKLYKNV